jgi:hypothetical protein
MMDDGLLMIRARPSFNDHQSSIANYPYRGHTLAEAITVVLILSILACVAVPRLNWAAVTGVTADAFVRQITTDLRRTRADAILHAGRNPTGFALIVSPEVPYHGYQIIDLRDATVVVARDLPPGVRCTGGKRFEFGPLGNLRAGSDTELHITTEARTYRVTVVPATGAVKWGRHNE